MDDSGKQPEVVSEPPQGVSRQEFLVQIAAQLNTYIGALPHPEILERYDRLVPGSAERLLSMAEQQSAHRIGMEKKVVDHEIDQAKSGLAVGAIVTLGMEVVCAVLAITGHGTAAAILGGTSLAALAGVFVYGTQSRKSERIEKTKVMTEQLRLPLEGSADQAPAGSTAPQ